MIASDRADGLGYMEASPFDAGVRGGWRKAGPPHRQRMLRLSVTDPGTITLEGSGVCAPLLSMRRCAGSVCIFRLPAIDVVVGGVGGVGVGGVGGGGGGCLVGVVWFSSAVSIRSSSNSGIIKTYYFPIHRILCVSRMFFILRRVHHCLLPLS